MFPHERGVHSGAPSACSATAGWQALWSSSPTRVCTTLGPKLQSERRIRLLWPARVDSDLAIPIELEIFERECSFVPASNWLFPGIGPMRSPP